MTTAIVGAGSIGGTVARLLSDSGEPITLAAGHVPEEAAHEIGGNVSAATVADAIDRSEVVVLAVWFDVMKQVVEDNKERLAGKVVIDTCNPVAFDDAGTPSRTLPDGVSAGSVIAGLLPDSAHYVKAFGTLAAKTLQSQAHRSPERGVLFFATDDDTAQAAATRLITASGYDPVRAGGLDAALQLEMFGDLHEFGGLNGQVLDRRQARTAVGPTGGGGSAR